MMSVIATVGIGGMAAMNIPNISAVDEDSCANQNARQDRFEDRFEGDDENPNNDNGATESWLNSFKNREPC
jgi:hypothetical protein